MKRGPSKLYWNVPKMGKCFSVVSCGLVKRFNSSGRKIVLLLAGLDNAGKTTAAKGLIGDPVDKVVPTVGFTSIRLIHRGFNVIIYDVGGGPQIRGIWNKYFSDVHGVIFVVDASDGSRIGESKNELEKLLCHEKLAGKPFLILANKQDVRGAMDEIDIVERLNLEQLVNQQKCPTLVEICSSVPADNKKTKTIDPGLLKGYRWLLHQVISDYSKLNARVEKDMKEEQERINTQRESWRSGREMELESEEIEENGNDFFRPIGELVKDIEKEPKVIKNNFKTRDESADLNQNTKLVVEVNKTNSMPEANGHIPETDGCSFVADIRGQLENKGNQQRKKSIGRKNRVGPELKVACELPPLILAGHRSMALDALTSPQVTLRSAAVSNLEAAALSEQQAMAINGLQAQPKYLLPPLRRPQELRPFTSRSLGNEVEAWGLHEDLELVLPKFGSHREPKSDDEDVVMS